MLAWHVTDRGYIPIDVAAEWRLLGEQAEAAVKASLLAVEASRVARAEARAIRQETALCRALRRSESDAVN
jgi:hypothetical protein